MARMASSSNHAPVKSESIRTEVRVHVVTTPGTAGIILSTSMVAISFRLGLPQPQNRAARIPNEAQTTHAHHFRDLLHDFGA
jgi:hypothetical protein